MNVSSESSFTVTSGTLVARPEKGWAVTLMGAGALEVLVRSLSIELAPVRVNVVSPGLIETEMTAGMIQQIRGAGMEQNMTLTNKLGQPTDVAESYLYIMKDKFITGTCVSTDGGRLMMGPSRA
jgi:NAD(P)-dependent dehydrogenase (short-subunit alcohol dehydrogenase family)